jgi:hypothetical protein
MAATYVLYLCQEWRQESNKPIILGVGNDPTKLYQNALNPQTAEKSNKSLILKWLTHVETKLDEQEQREMDYAFTKNPQTEFSYSIKEMTLYMKKIKEY